MLRLNLNVISYVAFMWLALASFSANAQSNTCLIHDHHCINHGIGRLVGTVPSDTTSISATANWDQDNDIDLHVLAPAGPSYSAPLEALPGFPLNITAPFFPDVTGAHVYPNHYQSEIDGGVATITHSGDDGQGLATYPDQPGCLNQTGVSCENITVEGAVPGGVYSYALHAFPGTNTAFPPTQYDLEIQANGNLVLVMEEADQGNLTGVMEGTGSQSARIDVFAVNVGHSGHMGGVTLPEYEQYIRADGMVSYRPAEPDDPSISPYFVQNTIKGQFNARDEYVAQLDFLRDQEVERRRRVYLAYLAEQERLRQARLKAELELTLSPYQNQLCNPKYQYCGAPLALTQSPVKLPYDTQSNVYSLPSIDGSGQQFWYAGEQASFWDKSTVLWKNTVSWAKADPFKVTNEVLQQKAMNKALGIYEPDASFADKTLGYSALFGVSVWETVVPTSNKSAGIDVAVTVGTLGTGKLIKTGCKASVTCSNAVGSVADRILDISDRFRKKIPAYNLNNSDDLLESTLSIKNDVTKNAGNSSKADILNQNKKKGEAFEQETIGEKKIEFPEVGEQITIKTESGVKTKVDIMTKDIDGNIGCIECKSSKTASFTKNQKIAFPEIENTGGTIVGKGKPGFEGGTVLPPTKVEIIRPSLE